YIYENGNIDELSKIVERLIDNPENRRKISKAAYETIANVWNSKNAADNLVQLSKDLLNGAGDNNIKTGPCSKTDRFSNNWYIGE
ncbi:MAG: glycosyltransferase, partial [Clostridia bacterium]|nr:glycosyltransferase [Clostridia bacterium]